MRVLKRALAIVYLAAAVVALGTLVCQFWGPYTYRFMLLMRDPLPRIVVTACGGVVALGVLVCFFRLIFARREPSCVHPAGERNIEVTLAALSSCARTAAERDDRVMVEHVEARVQGSDESRVRFKVDAIALDDRDVASLAAAMQQRIEEACDTMLGTPGTTARVRFCRPRLPSRPWRFPVSDTNQDKTVRTPRLTIDQSAAPASEVVDPKVEVPSRMTRSPMILMRPWVSSRVRGQPSGAMPSVIPIPRLEPSLVLCSPYWCSRSACGIRSSSHSLY